MVNVLVGSGPAAQAEAGTTESVSVAKQLGLTADSAVVGAPTNLQPLEDLAASRSTREAEQTAAAKAQSAADQAERNRQKAEADAKAKAEAQAEASAKAKAKTEAKAKAAAAASQQAQVAAPAAPSSTAATAVAHISNSAGDVRPQVQTAANAVVSNVAGAAGITLGGTRASATDPHGHPSGLALDYMVLSDSALGDAIVQYHRRPLGRAGRRVPDLAAALPRLARRRLGADERPRQPDGQPHGPRPRELRGLRPPRLRRASDPVRQTGGDEPDRPAAPRRRRRGGARVHGRRDGGRREPAAR